MKVLSSNPFRTLAVAALLCTRLTATAGDASTTFNVTATVLATCAISASNVAFGNYSSAQTDATGTLTVNCTNLVPYAVSLDAGAGSGATVSERRMSKAGGTLTYGLYRDAARTLVWGHTSGVDTVGGIGSGGTQTITVYGRLPASQLPDAGAYSDTVTATVTY